MSTDDVNALNVFAKLSYPIGGLAFSREFEGTLGELIELESLTVFQRLLHLEFVILVLPAASQNNSLNELTRGLFEEALDNVGLKTQEYYNQRLGTYDRMRNEVVPSPMGLVFPDGNVQVMWTPGQCTMPVEEAAAWAWNCYQTLLELQEIAYFQSTEEEVNSLTPDTREDRLLEGLLATGFWPDQDGVFLVSDARSRKRTLDGFKAKAPVGVPCPSFD